MRAFCAILLVGIVAYVQAASDSCDYLAVNVAKAGGVKRSGSDFNNQELSLEKFLSKKKGWFYTTRATPYKNEYPCGDNVDEQDEQDEYESPLCTAVTHGKNCDGVEYVRKLKEDYKANRPEMLKGVQFETTFIGYDSMNGKSAEFTMTIGGIDHDDYIFQWVEGTEITVKTHEGSKPTTKILKEQDIDDGILNTLKSKFALNSYNEGGYNLYVTCDGDFAWVTYNKEVTSPTDDTQLQQAIETLKNNIKNTIGIDDPDLASRHIDPGVFPIYAAPILEEVLNKA